MTWWIITSLASIAVTVGGMAFRIYYLRSKQERVLEKQLKTTIETNRGLDEISTRPRADGEQLADRFRMSKD